MIDFGKDEQGKQIYKTWEEGFLFFSKNKKEYVYACRKVGTGKDFTDLEPENLLAMASNFNPAQALSVDDFSEVYKKDPVEI